MPIIIVLGIVVCILLFLFFIQRREMKSISGQLKEIKNENTNMLIHSENGAISAELVNEVNELLKEVRDNRVLYQCKNHELEQMMINISHDLRTPLTSALGYIDIIRNADLSQEEKLREIAIVEQRLLRIEELINSFFEFYKIISGHKLADMVELNLVSVLEESIVHYYDDYCGKNREILFRCDKTKINFVSNRNMLMRIFDNLIGNALKHGKGNLTITVRDSDGIRIRFENELIDADIDIDYIFDEFYTTDISRTRGNTGLGLAIAKQFTEMLGGNISAQCRDKTFIISVDF